MKLNKHSFHQNAVNYLGILPEAGSLRVCFPGLFHHPLQSEFSKDSIK